MLLLAILLVHKNKNAFNIITTDDISSLFGVLSTTANSNVTMSKTIPSKHTTTTLQELLLHTPENCSGDYRNYPNDVQDSVNTLLGQAILQEPKVPIRNDIPPQLPSEKQLCYDKRKYHPETLTGKPYYNERPLYVAILFSHEIDLLEARLFEGIGIVDKVFIGESRYTHRGHSKPMLVTESLQNPNSRLARFKHMIEIVDLDKDTIACYEYQQAIQQYRTMTSNKPRIIWWILNAASVCLANKVKEYALQHDPTQTALVQVSDLDEIIFRETLATIKFCEFRSNLNWPITVGTTYNLGAKFCDQPEEHHIKRLLFRANEMTGERTGTGKHQINGGIHLSYFGGSLIEFFKSTNHAEGGGLNKLGWLTTNHNPSVCDAKREDWYQREKLLCVDKGTVLAPWIPKSPPRNEKSLPINMVHNPKLLPWIIYQNKDRYPCFFDDYQTCTDTYIDFLVKAWKT